MTTTGAHTDGSIQIRDVEVVDDGQVLALRIQTHNSAARPLLVCATVRALTYDADTRTLEVVLGERGPAAGGLGAPQTRVILPRIVAIGAGADASIDVTVPRLIARPAAGEGQVTPTIERLPAHEATTIVVEMAFGDEPFSGPGWATGWATHRKQRGAAAGKARRRRPRSTGTKR